MSGHVDAAVVEKAARAFLATPGDYPGEEEALRWAENMMHAALTAVWEDLTADRDRLAARLDAVRALCAGPPEVARAPAYVRISAVLDIVGGLNEAASADTEEADRG